MPRLDKIRPHLWFAKGAREAAEFYVSVFPDSRIDDVWTVPAETPSGPPGSVEIVNFVLAGQHFIAMAAGELDPFNHAISLYVTCDDQAEVDHYWNALLEGGHAEQCGWLRDRNGIAWQIVPRRLEELCSDPNSAVARRVTEAMLGMVKLDIAELEKAAAATVKEKETASADE
jgi:predicted 3-demethylubiquinone-9 3-methyltransferase (glyoxalase superfamily)